MNQILLLNNIMKFNRISIIRIAYCIVIFLFSNIEATAQNNEFLKKQYERLEELLLKENDIEANRIADSIIKLSPKGSLDHDFLMILHEKGKALEFLTRYVESLNIYFDVLNRSKKAKDHFAEALTYLSLARIYDNLSRKEEFKSNLDNARSIIHNYDINYLRAELAIRSASYHRFFGGRDSSLFYTKQGIYYANKYQIKKLIPDGYLMMGHLSTKNEEKIGYYKKAASIFRKYKNDFGAASQYLNVAHYYSRDSNYVNVKINLDSARYMIFNKYSTDLELYYLKYRYQSQIAEYYEHFGKLDSSNYYLKLSHIYRDSADRVALSDKVLKYEVDIAVLKEKQQQSELKSRSYYLLIALIAASTISLLLWWFLRKNTNKNNIIQRKNEVILDQNIELERLLLHQKKLLSEVHHRVKNNLQLVISLMAIKSNASDNQIFKDDLEDIASKIQSMSLIHEQLYRVGEFSVINISDYLTDIANYFKDILKNDMPIEIKTDVNNEINLNIETTLPIGIIIVELLNNSIKYARPVNDHLIINIDLHQVNSEYLLAYADNGIEITPNKKGLGTLLIENMGRQLNGRTTYLQTAGFSYKLLFIQKQVSAIDIDPNNNK